MEGDVTLAEWGAETVHDYVDGDPKTNFTFFATITAEGTNEIRPVITSFTKCWDFWVLPLMIDHPL
jgi:hypothetical protein